MYYDYHASVAEDVKDYIESNYTPEEIAARLEEDRDEFEQELNDEMWTADSVTGNGSGSYTFNRAKAMEYLGTNFDLLAEAVEEFGGGMDVIKDGPEACDVTIRCYLLGQAISAILDEYEE